MIPKKIHCCWLSGEKLPYESLMCLKSWQKHLPDYEIVLWDIGSLDISSVDYLREACEQQQWAFASDYIRLYALYHQGGIYLDLDVFVLKNLDQFLPSSFFSAVECHSGPLSDVQKNEALESGRVDGFGMQAAIMGAEPKHKFIKDCLTYYENRSFNEDYRNRLNNSHKMLAPDIYAQLAVAYGYEYTDKEQCIDSDMVIYPSAIFASSMSLVSSDAYAVHCCVGTWRQKSVKRYLRILLNRLLIFKLSLLG